MPTCQHYSTLSSDTDATRRMIPVSACGPLPAAKSGLKNRLKRLTALVEQDPRRREQIRRMAHPEAERIIVTIYKPPQKTAVMRAYASDDTAAYLNEIRWQSRFCRKNPGTVCVSFGDTLIRSELAVAAWEGKQERLGAAIARGLEAAGIPRSKDAYLRATKDMALNDLIQLVPISMP